MSLSQIYSGPALLALIGALLLSCLIYLKDFKSKIVSIANLCSLLAFSVSLVYAINVLSTPLNDPAEFARMLANSLLVNLYAGICNVVARVWVRVNELKGSKRLKIRVHAEIVDR